MSSVRPFPGGPLIPMILTGLAGGMGWGIRGQYGHETGAMIAGLLVGLVLVLWMVPDWSWSSAARAVAWVTLAIGVGGSETYAQSIGLTQDQPLIGHADAWRWGMAGLSIKGGVWIGFAGLFLGMGMGGVRYRPSEAVIGITILLALHALGVHWLNQPYDPSHRLLPKLYFSADWRWLPGASLKPRREVWGGLVLALAGAWVWAGWIRRDVLARFMGGWGVLGGAIGFPLGQCLQSYRAWHPDRFREGIWIWLDPCMNWWNWMETSFGVVMGATLALGLWCHRGRLREAAKPEVASSLSFTLGGAWMAVHAVLVSVAEFGSVPGISGTYNYGLHLLLLPLAVVLWDSRWAVFQILPVTLLPIAGKTYNQLVRDEHFTGPGWGGLFYVVIPLAATTVLAAVLSARPRLPASACRSAAWTLALASTCFWWLNTEFFHRPWPWVEWTKRTPNQLFFTVAWLALLGLSAVRLGFVPRLTSGSESRPMPAAR